MTDVIILIIFVLSAAGIIYIIYRRLPRLAQTENRSIKQDRETGTKQDIITRRLERKFSSFGSIISKYLRPLLLAIKSGVKKLYQKIAHLEWQYRNLSKQKSVDDPMAVRETAQQITEEIDDHVENKNYDQAEKKLIELISLDPNNIELYRHLGELYMEMGDFVHARETLEFVISLAVKKREDNEIIDASTNVELAADHIDLGLALRELKLYNEALENIEHACKLEANNPRNLDILLETSIMAGDKVLAWEAFDRLKETNPENKKLDEFEKKLKEMDKSRLRSTNN
ncbi:MAG: tetratricopeptide repeat protein [Patescibacteria group bacterium]|nr:tetratricopeptide repeat protein [Patescibacteria group bacterium]